MLARRSHSRRQLANKLLTKAESSVVESVLDQLEAEKYLDDSEYAFSRADYLQTHKKWGSNKIRQDLKSQGIGATIVTRVLEEVNREKRERICLEEVVQSWVARHGKPTGAKDVQRLFSHCVRRGFARSMVRDSLESYLAGVDWTS